jgi:hypothetical protein
MQKLSSYKYLKIKSFQMSECDTYWFMYISQDLQRISAKNDNSHTHKLKLRGIENQMIYFALGSLYHLTLSLAILGHQSFRKWHIVFIEPKRKLAQVCLRIQVTLLRYLSSSSNSIIFDMPFNFDYIDARINSCWTQWSGDAFHLIGAWKISSVYN